MDFAVAFDYAADYVEFFFGAVEQVFGACELVGGDGGDEADAHVESPHHLVFRDLAELAEVLEDGKHGPGADFDLRGGAFGQDAREIFRDAAAGDVRHASGEARSYELLDDVEVAAVRLHERRASFFFDGGDVLGGLVAGDFKEELAGERVTIGVQAGGGQSDEDVAGFNGFSGDHLVAVHGTDDEAGEVIFSIGVEAGHLRGFTADEGAAVGFAGFGEAGDNGFDDGGVELAGGEVIQEEQRRRALDGDVVDAVVDEIGADGVVAVELEGDFELGSYAVCGADEDGAFELLQVKAEERAEASDASEDVPVEGFLREVLDAILGAVASGDVNAGVGVGDGLGAGFRHRRRLSAGRMAGRVGAAGKNDFIRDATARAGCSS
jgi:hypothetical protein